MAFEYKRIDVDSHCQEKPDAWTSRMSKAKWGDRIPQIVEKDGREVWMCDGRVMMNGWISLCHGVIPDRKSLPTHWRDVPSIVYTADGRMRAMDRDGVSAQVLFPNTAGVGGEAFMMRMDPELQKDCVRAYNDYLAEEFYDVAPHRFITLAELPLATVEAAVAELKHAANRGHRGFLMIGATEQYRLPAFADRYWDPLWANCSGARHAGAFPQCGGRQAAQPWLGTGRQRHENARNGECQFLRPLFTNFCQSLARRRA